MKRTRSSRLKNWFFSRSMARAYQEWLEKRTRSDRKAAKKATRRPLFAEALEPRVLFSATPAPVEEAPAEGNGEAIVHTSEELISADNGQKPVSIDEDVDVDFTEEDLERLAAEAVARWEESGLTAEQLEALENISYAVTDLEGDAVGAAEGNTVFVDVDAAGADWFVDDTEWLDEEFVEIDGLLRAVSGENGDDVIDAGEGVDLLSVIMHEQGHILGLPHSDLQGLMSETLGLGQRKLPEQFEAVLAIPGSLADGHHFLTFSQQTKLNAGDAAASDFFGYSVAVDGDTAVIGAHNDDDGGTNSGSAYVFTRSGTTWTQQAKLNAGDAAANDWFGWSVALDGDTAVIGAFFDDDGAANSGSAYVFTRSGTVWTQQAKLNAGDAVASDYFGVSVAVDGDTAVIGAHLDDDGGTNSGSAYVFTRSGTTWTQQAKLNAGDAAGSDLFGRSVALDGDTVVIGADGDDDGGTDSGSVYVFSRSGTTWTQQAKLNAGDAAASDFFGYSVAVDGDTAVIGAYNDDDGGTNSGSAYVFTRSGSTWTQQVKLNAGDAAATDWFGRSVAVDGATAVIGADRGDDGGTDSGSAYVFTVDVPTTSVAVNGTTGDLEITDVAGADTDDDITIVVDGTDYHITDATNSIDQRIAIVSVTGNIVIEGTGGDDTLTIDLSGGAITRPIIFNGGAGGNDDLVITGGTVATATYNSTNENDGSIELTGNGLITYTGLEPITSMINATDVILNYGASSETISVTDATVFGTGALSNPTTITDNTNLDGARSVTMSPDGKNVYIVSRDAGSVTVFDRDAVTGALTNPTTITDAINLDFALDVAVSPDGKNVYIASNDADSVTVFDRDAGTGALSNQRTITDHTNLDGAAGVTVSSDGAHAYIVSRNADSVTVFDRDAGTGTLTNPTTITDATNLNGASGVTMSPDGKNVYIVSLNANSVTVFDRDAVTGALSNPATITDGANLNGASGVTVSPDGKNVYVASSDADSVTVFDRDAVTGALSNPTTIIDNTNLDYALGVTVSQDGQNVYIASLNANSVTVFDRDTGTGALTNPTTITDGTNLNGSSGVTVSPDGKSVYIASLNANSLTVFDRDANISQITVDSTAGEVVTFNNPTNSLTINAGSGNDIIDLNGLGSGFAADLTLNGGTGDDTVNLNGEIAFAADKNLDVDLQDDDATPGIDTVNFGAGANIVISGAGTATVKASGDVGFAEGSALATEDGDVTLESGADISVAGVISSTSGDINIDADEDISVNAAVTTSGGDVNLEADNDVTLNAGVITSGGAFNGTADSDGDGDGDFTLAEAVLGAFGQQSKLTADDAAAGDEFGYSVAVDGDTAVIGARSDDDGGSSSGSVYVFMRSGADWVQQAKLTAGDAGSGDNFGYSVAIDGDTVVVGAYFDDDGSTNSGSAYVFTRSGSAWTQQAKLTAGDAAFSDYFGYSVAVDGDTAVIGAYLDDDGGSSSGSAYVFTRNGSAWTQQSKLTAADAAASDQFGWSVAVDGDTAVIGAIYKDDGALSRSGSAYVFARSGLAWTQQAKLTADDAFRDDNFGWSVAVDGDTAVIGAYRDDDGGSESGSAYVFTRSGSDWTQQSKLRAKDAASGDRFGQSVEVDGDTVVIGAMLDDDGGSSSGSAYMFTRNGSDWTQQEKLTAGDAASNDNFGRSVAFGGGTVFIGASGDDDDGGQSGSAYTFVRLGGTPGGSIAAGTGDVAISAENVVVRGSVDTTTGNISATAKANLSTTAAVTSTGGDISLAATTIATGDIFVDAEISSGGGAVSLTAAEGVTVNAGVDTGGGAFNGTADSDGDGSGDFILAEAVIAAFAEQAKLTAGDAAAGDSFGWSVAVDGDTAVIGAYLDDDGGANSGSAYVFTRSGSGWIQQAKLTAGDAAAGDSFGWSVAVDGDTVVIGAYRDISLSGSAYVFTRSGSTWTQQAKLTAGDAASNDYFGWSVSVDGDTAVIGANLDDDGGSSSGSAYVFTRNGSAWTQQSKITAGDAAAGDQFGFSVAVDGDTAVIGAYQDDDGVISRSGSAYVFTRSGLTWTQQAKLTAGDASRDDFFGHSVAIDGDTAVIGAYLDDDGGSASGSAYVFTRSGAAWAQQAKLNAGDPASNDYFGWSVAIDGDTAVIGAFQDDGDLSLVGSDSGSVYVFTRSGAAWTQQTKLTASDAKRDDHFGYSVAVDGNTAFIGAKGNDDDGSLSGSAYAFSVSDLNPGGSISAGAGGVTILGENVLVRGAVDTTTGEISATAKADLSTTAAVTTAGGNISLAAGADLSTTAAITAAGGDISLASTSTGDISVGGSVDSGGGAVSFTGVEGVSLEASVDTGGGAFNGTADSDGDGSGDFTVSEIVLDTFVHQSKLTADDAESGDRFGFSMAVDGDTAVVGAHDSNGSQSGSATVFTRSGSGWIQQAKLTASDAFGGDGFGYSVTVDGDTVVIGAYRDDDGGIDSGSAYVFTRIGSAWTEQAKLTADDAAPGDNFGRSVTVDGDTAVIGAIFDEDGGYQSGSAYVFTRNGSAWGQQAKITAADAASSDYFGGSLAVDGDTVVIGAYGDDDGGNSSGSAYVFTRSGSDWTEQFKLTADDAASNKSFGYSVAVDGDTVLIGAIGDNDAGSNSGSAYVFTGSGSAWTQQAKLTAEDAAASDSFGLSVAIDGDTAVIGVFGNDDAGSNSGSAYVFARKGSDWFRQAKLSAGDAASGDEFGRSVAVNGDTAFIGANLDDDGGSSSGSAYTFSLSDFDPGGSIAADAGGVTISGQNVVVSGAVDTTTGDISATSKDEFSTAAAIGSTSGNISVIADAVDITAGISSSGTLTIASDSASTTIGVGGGAGDLNLDDAELGFLQDGFSSITIGDAAAGDIDIDSATFTDSVELITGGEVHDGVGTDIDMANGDTVTINGTVAPGQSPGILDVTGDFAFAVNTTFEVEIGGSSPGTAPTDHDQISVTNGGLSIGSGTILNLSNYLGNYTPTGGDILNIVNLVTLGELVTGTFVLGTGGTDGNGGQLAEGDIITNFLGSGLEAKISYTGGTDSNDVVITVGGTKYDFSAATYSSAEGNATNNTMVVTVNRTGSTNGASSVEVALAAGATNGATVGDDFTAGTITVDFADGEASKTVTIELLGDSILELDETIALTLQNASGSGEIGTTQATAELTITNDDSATVTIADATITEGSDLEFAVTLSNAVDVDTEITYSTSNGTATTADSDYTAQTSQTLTILAGQTTGTITVATTGDNQVELDETVDVTLSAVSVGGRDVTITESGNIPASLVEFDASSLGLTNNDVVGAWGGQAASGTPTYLTGQTPNGGAAVEFNGGDRMGDNVSLSPSASGDWILAMVIKPTNIGAYHNLADQQLNLPMLWIDNGGNYEFNASSPSGLRPQAGTGPGGWDIVIADSRLGELYVNSSTANTTGWLTKSFTTAQTFDFFHRNGGQTYQGQVAEFRVYNDRADFGGDFAALYNDLEAKWFGSATGTATATGTITNDDSATVTIADASVIEGGNLVFDLTLDNAVDVATTVTYSTADLFALTGGDYTGATGATTTILAGALTGSITVATTADTDLELDEDLLVTLDGLSASGREVSLSTGGTATLDALDAATGLILSDEFPTTAIVLNGTTLEIDDIEGGTTIDNLFIRLDGGGNLIVEDLNGNTVGSNVIGSVQIGVSRVDIPIASLAGGLTVNTNVSDDTINLGNLGTLAGNLTVNGGVGQDNIIQTGDVVLTGGSTVTYTAERVRLEGGADLTTDTGDVTIAGNGGTGNGVGVILKGGSINSTSGNVAITGEGGDSGVYNRGILLDVDSVAGVSTISTGGSITLAGTGGSTGVHATGVTLIGATVESTGAGPVMITGSGGTGLLFSEGVAFHKGTTIDAGTGDLTIMGTGGSTGSMNRGVMGSISDLITDGGNIAISGTGGGTMLFGIGVDLSAVDMTTIGTGSVTITGTGASGTLGNMGVRLAGNGFYGGSVSTEDGAINITGTGNGSTLQNHGVQLLSGFEVEATGTGNVTITGTSGAGTILNHGVTVSTGSSVRVGDGGAIEVRGTSLGTVSVNKGVDVSGSNLRATGSGTISVWGTGSASASGVLNTGVSVSGGGISSASGDILVSGLGGTGTTMNEGVRMVNATVRSTALGAISLSGTANAGTTGVLNSGMYLLSVQLESGGIIGISGTGGGGSLLNHGIYMQNMRILGSTPMTVGRLGTGSMSEDESGNFFS